jgi:hypothetical protein
MDRSPARHRPGREIWPEGARGGDACRIRTDQAIEHIHVLALLIWGEFADWGLVHLQEDFACRRMPAVDGLSAFKQCAKIADFRRVPSHATFCLCRGATAASDQMLGIAGHRRCSRRLIDCRQPRRLRTHCHEPPDEDRGFDVGSTNVPQ